MTGDVAALMLTNPSTLGIFEQRIPEIAKMLHAKGASALHGWRKHERADRRDAPRRSRRGRDAPEPAQNFSTPHGGGGPGAGPVAIKKILEPYLPVPVLVEKEGGKLALDYHRKETIGRVRAFGGNFGVLVRALAYILAYGPGVRQATEDAVLNANYIRKHLEGVFDLAVHAAIDA